MASTTPAKVEKHATQSGVQDAAAKAALCTLRPVADVCGNGRRLDTGSYRWTVDPAEPEWTTPKGAPVTLLGMLRSEDSSKPFGTAPMRRSGECKVSPWFGSTC